MYLPHTYKIMPVVHSRINYTSIAGRENGTVDSVGDYQKYGIAVLRSKCYVRGSCTRSFNVI